jgi:lipoyl(octanoyl) transferase
MRAYWLGRVEYAAAWKLQKELATLRAERRMGDILLLLEHPPTITLGRGASTHHIVVPMDELERLGVTIQQVDRGGDVTYHGPGQLVGYLICHLGGHGKDLHLFLRRIEEALIEALATFGVQGCRFPPHTGVWVNNGKIAAIGIKVTKWVSTHGFALNVSPDLRHFQWIVPCGIHNYGVTSLHAILGYTPGLSEVLRSIVNAFGHIFPDMGDMGTTPWELLSEASRRIMEPGSMVEIEQGVQNAKRF